jgi:hypothetical protein
MTAARPMVATPPRRREPCRPRASATSRLWRRRRSARFWRPCSPSPPTRPGSRRPCRAPVARSRCG